MKKSYLFATLALLLVCFVAFDAQAQTEIETLKNNLVTTTTSMKNTYTSIRNVIYVICGVIGLTVLPGKYQKMQSGDPDAGKSMINWGGSLIFIAAAAYILQLIFFTV